MSDALAVATLSFVLTLLAGRPFLAFLQRRGIGKRIREEGPEGHSVKAGTPTMGGMLIFLTVFIVTIPFNLAGRLSMLVPLGTIMSSGFLGAVDDLMTLQGGSREGLRARFKFGWLLLIALWAAISLHYLFELRTMYIPFAGKVDIGAWYVPIITFAIVGSSNAVNLTDGLDGLAGGTAALAFAAYGIIAFLQEQAYLATFCFTVTGAVLGFLWYNVHPAQMFMGDTGSLALGATLAVVAAMTGHWLLLPLIGVVFVIETLSVFLQVGYFKLSGGKRLLLMSPLHHHFEMVGWSETQITLRFWLFGVLGAMLGVALALV